MAHSTLVLATVGSQHPGLRGKGRELFTQKPTVAMGAVTLSKGRNRDNGQLGDGAGGGGREGEPRETNSFPSDLLPAPPTGGTQPEVGSEGCSPSRPALQATEEGDGGEWIWRGKWKL